MSEINKQAYEMAEKIADLLKSRDLSEISLHADGLSVCVKAKSAPVISMPAMQPVQSVQPEQAGEKPPDGNVIKSPIVGTFYAAPAPDKPAFVKVGDRVEKGQVVCIIESMKLMNEITSEFSGTVSAVYPKDGEAVEFEQRLILID